MKGRLRFLWVTDPWDRLDHPSDTTLRFIEECAPHDVEAWWCDARAILSDRGRPLISARQVRDVGSRRMPGGFRFGRPTPLAPGEFAQIHYRVDPPVDLSYLQPLQILMSGDAASGPKVVNPAPLLMTASEKLEAGLLRGLAPPALASSDREALLRFGRREGRVVLKPLHECQSHGVELLDLRRPAGARGASRLLSKATSGFTLPVLLQRFLPGISEGEQRLWYVDGVLLACVRKLPRSGEFRIDMDRGGRLAPTRLDARERKAAQAIGRHLRARGIRLAAVDLIEGFVTDFNFTSPGLIVGMERLLGENLAAPILKRLKLF